WNMLAVTVHDDDGKTPVDWRLCLVPKSDYEIIDTWYAMGMAATGSKDVAVNELFVPERRAPPPLAPPPRGRAPPAPPPIPAPRSTPARCFASRWWPPPATHWRRRRWVRPKAPTSCSSRRWPSGRALTPAPGWRIFRPCRSRLLARAV